MASNNEGNFLNAFLLGGIVGFVIGILAAPRSGEEIRAEISERTKGVRAQVEQLTERVREQLHREAPAEGDTSPEN